MDTNQLAQELEQLLAGNGYNFPPGLRIFGIRNNDNWELQKFDDILVLFDSSAGFTYSCWGTTTPGKPYEDETLRSSKGWPPGVLHLKKEVLQINMWGKGQYMNTRALVQVGPAFYWRDMNQDHVQDPEEGDQYDASPGAHFHTRRGTDDNIGWASAGCQVPRFPANHERCMDIAFNYPQERYSYCIIMKDNVPGEIFGKLTDLAAQAQVEAGM